MAVVTIIIPTKSGFHLNLDCLFMQRASIVAFVLCPGISIRERAGETRWSPFGHTGSVIEDAFVDLANFLKCFKMYFT